MGKEVGGTHFGGRERLQGFVLRDIELLRAFQFALRDTSERVPNSDRDKEITYDANIRVCTLEIELLKRRNIGNIVHEHLHRDWSNPQLRRGMYPS